MTQFVSALAQGLAPLHPVAQVAAILVCGAGFGALVYFAYRVMTAPYR